MHSTRHRSLDMPDWARRCSAEMPDQLPKRVRTERVKRLTEIESSLRESYFASLMGSRLQLLVETQQSITTIAGGHAGKLLCGTTCRYAPAELVTQRTDLGVGSLVAGTVVRSDGEKLELRL